ncbi:lipase family protein [Nocardia sp. alder85J]|uniref:lipase family protein n=1 Tax=Nocardia sp. alder85J TaxID=2862949 RepID=UPI001CD48083|nr:lipase family protein [Nocardia sp. alder85J]MCX4090954.1 lipase family protein [Nocardia sp. alder85J]
MWDGGRVDGAGRSESSRARRGATRLLAAVVATAAVQCGYTAVASAAPDDFFTYDDSALAGYAPGTVPETRTLPYHLAGLPIPVTAIQIRYRSTDAQGRPASNITTVLEPPGPRRAGEAVSYQSFYDSLNPEDSPSRAVAGGVSLGQLVNTAEGFYVAQLLARGLPVLIPDTEGQQADFAAGPEYGYNTLDSIRAAAQVDGTGIDDGTRIGLLGYSGGAIATNWAAALAPSYAPEVNDRLVGASEGGVLVDPARNLLYVDGSIGWAGVAGMAILGVGRAYDIDFSPYLSEYATHLLPRMRSASIADVLFQYPGLTWAQLVKPEYADPDSVPPYTAVTAKIDLGNAPTPTVPMFIGQAANGVLEGTDGSRAGIGPGDAVMVAGDVRALARQYCETGNTAVDYVEYGPLSHITAAPLAMQAEIDWLDHRLAGEPAPSTCASIAPGNTIR